VGADHGGFPLKAGLAPWLSEKGYEVLDMGAETLIPTDDYPDYALAVAESVASGKAQRGIIVCGSGIGACIAANKVSGVRACVCHDTYSAHQGVEHDNMNVICLGARVVGEALAKEIVDAFLKASFSGEERHQRRLQKVMDIESQNIMKKKGG
jgi:ribose 5-phosphate isomerase B